MLAGLALLATPLATHAWERGKVETFATLPAGEAHPEGIAVDREGNVYVATVAVNKPSTSEGTLIVFDPQGKHLRTVGIKGSSRLLLDIDFHPQTRQAARERLQGRQGPERRSQDGRLHGVHDGHGQEPRAQLDAFDDAGNVYVTDSHQGIIWKVGPDGGEATAWVTSPLLKPTRLPPGIGANGLAFNNSNTALFVANTANDIIVRIPLTGPTLEPGTPEVFVHRVGGGPDGLHIDEHDNLWVACNQSNEIVVLEPTQGRVIAKLGDSGGVDRDGAPIGFLWSNTFVFRGDDILVTNLSLDLGSFIPRACRRARPRPTDDLEPAHRRRTLGCTR